MGKKILLIGGGGHCRSVIDSLRAESKYDEIGIVLEEGAQSNDRYVIGSDADLPALKGKGWEEIIIAVGSVGDTTLRQSLFQKAEALGFRFPVIIDPSAVVASDALIGAGTYIGKRAVINTGVRIGRGTIINTGAVLEHDCLVNDHVHISTGAILCGEVAVGAGTHIGAGSVVRQGIHIGNSVLVGIGSVVVCDIPDRVTAYGNPCRVRK